MSTIGIFRRLAPLLFLMMSALAQAEGPIISSVKLISDEGALTLDIAGKDLTDGVNPVVVSLGGSTLAVDTETATFVRASATGAIDDGDYLLAVTNGRNTVTYSLTIGAVGPRGPAGPAGPTVTVITMDEVTTDAVNNTSAGLDALANNTTGVNNSAYGRNALRDNTAGIRNTATGSAALLNNVDGGRNTASGVGALRNNTSGNNNTASGDSALKNNISGSNNIAVGKKAGENIQLDNNIAVGNPGEATDIDTIRIGNSQTRAFMAGINGNDQSTGSPVYVGADGHLGTGLPGCTIAACPAEEITTITCGAITVDIPCFPRPMVVAYIDIDGSNSYGQGDTLIAGIFDIDGDNQPSVGDEIRTDKYPLQPTGTAATIPVDDFTIKLHVITSISLVTSTQVQVKVDDDGFIWRNDVAAGVQEQYQESRPVPAGGFYITLFSEVFDGSSPSDVMQARSDSPSGASTAVTYTTADDSSDNDFISVDIL